MAGRSGGVSGMTYAVVLFVILFIVSTTLAILFYKDQEQLKADAMDARAQLNSFIDSAEREQEVVLKIRERAVAANLTVFGQLLRDYQGLVGTVNGDATAEVASVYAGLKALDVTDGNTVVGVLQSQQDELAKSVKLVASLQGQIKAADKKLATIDGLYKKQTAQFGTLDKKLSSSVGQLNADYEDYQKQVESQQVLMQKRMADTKREAGEVVRKNEAKLKQLEKDKLAIKERLDSVIKDNREETPDVPDASANIDGHIVAINNDDNLVYLDLGQSDHLVLGMTFEVFDALRGVQLIDGDLRGKATLEVVDIQESSAAARVVRSSFSRPMLPGDLIANLIYDRNHVYTFYVFGEFDLDGDGQYTIADHDSVVSLIQKWGGKVVDTESRREALENSLGEEVANQNQLPLEVDFVLVGKEPAMPLPPGRGVRDVVVITQYENSKRQWQQFIDIKQEAKTLSVPVINQNRFLALIGHTN